MGMRPDSMERWRAVDILKEAARLLHKHFRLFLPFFLAFQLPGSFLSVFQTVFLNASSGPPPPYTAFPFTMAQGSEMDPDGGQPPLILIMSLSLLVLVFSTLAIAAFTYIVAYIYSDSPGTESDDDAITKKVFKLLPHAFFRVFVTNLWLFLVMILVAIACVIFTAIVSAIFSAIIGGPSGPTPAFFLLMVVLYVVASVPLIIMFALAQLIAVVEPEKYGRAALKQSSKYAKGRARTIFCIFVFSVAVGSLIYASAQAVAQATLPLWVEIIVTLFMSILFSVVSTYVTLASVVMYFVCKWNFEAVLPEFQRGSNVPPAENPYKPLVH